MNPWKVGKYIPVDDASHPERLELSAAPLWKHQISQVMCNPSAERILVCLVDFLGHGHKINSETCYIMEQKYARGLKKNPVFVDKASFFSRIHKHRTWKPVAQSGCNLLLDLAPNFHLFPLLTHHLRGRRFTKLSWRLITQLTIFQLLPLAASRIMSKVNIFPNKTTRALILLRVTNKKKSGLPFAILVLKAIVKCTVSL